MEIIKRKISELKLDEDNLRKHGRENIEMIKKSLKEYTQYRPIIVDKNTDVVKIGNGRLQAMKEIGWTECDCIMLDFSDKSGLEVLDNRLNELSKWQDPEIENWLLDEKGVEWWGVDIDLSQELLKIEKRREQPKKEKKEKEEVILNKCPCCGKPLKKKERLILT